LKKSTGIPEILESYCRHPAALTFAGTLQQDRGGWYALEGLAGSQSTFLLASLYRLTQRNALVVLNDREEALYFLNDLNLLMPRKEILYFPASSKRPYQSEEIDNANVLQRAEVLNQLNHTHAGRILVVTFAEALSEKIINRRSLVKNTLEIRQGDKPGMSFLVDLLEEYSFERSDFVYEPGQYAIRGGILDVYSFAHELPYRIEFFGDEVDGIRVFDPVTQLSDGNVKQISLIPNIQKNLLDEERVDFLDYISPTTQVFIRNEEFVRLDLDRQFQKAEAAFQELQQKSGGGSPARNPSESYTSGSNFTKSLSGFTRIHFGGKIRNAGFSGILTWNGSPQPSFHREFSMLARHFHDNREQGIRNLIFSDSGKQIERLDEILAAIEDTVTFDGVIGEFHEGFLDHNLKIACYTDHQVFERFHKYKTKAQVSRSQALTLKELKDLQPGDYVTHIHHGIGRFAGLHRIKAGEHQQEAAKIYYRDEDVIFVPVNALYKISKYSGKEGEAPKLTKLGSAEWSRAKASVKKKVKELAFDLIALYAARKSRKGFSFAADTYMQQELEASFMFEDTADQIKSTQDVKQDMEGSIPMDRLICGDVGFGKTEIAIRAAFKAATDGKQIAVLVPTTILALQHFKTFSERLRNLPVTVDYISRFRSAKEQKETLSKLKEGKVDILIGTHRLVSKDVVFRDLGLLVIDEEQKFGVGVKEKLKTLKLTVDTLTLTATPIPRTLQFSLLGLRDLSVIATAPPNRQPVETVVQVFQQEPIRDAIAYELRRGGQVFFVHNRIHELEEMSALLRKLVPDARIAIAHGQMPGAQVEKVMSIFVEGGTDVLVCTTIIESGLDIPNANTIMINEAQNYGLSDLHQMRGRVGRSNRKAFCFLLAPHQTLLSKDAQKRLKAVEEFSDLGSGFHIALRDLDIRGAGDLFGAEQSGFIVDVGYDTYHKILDEAILELKMEHFADVFQEDLAKKKAAGEFVTDCTIESDLAILIPQSYLPSVSERLVFYNRIAAAEDEGGLRTIAREMIDRFGALPTEVLDLLDTVRLRWKGRKLGMEKILLKGGNLRLYFVADKSSAFYLSEIFGRIIAFAKDNHDKFALNESPKYLSLIVDDVEDIKDALFRLNEISDFVFPVRESSDEKAMT